LASCPGATVLWSLPQVPGDTEITVLAFRDLAPVQGDTPPPGPRVIFSVTRLADQGATSVRWQWYGDVALKPEALVVSPDLAEAKLEAKVKGTLEAHVSTGNVTRQEVEGTLKIQWVAKADPANTTLTVNKQGTLVGLQLNLVGQARLGQATVSVEVTGMGAPIQREGPGTVLSPSVGTLSLTLP